MMPLLLSHDLSRYGVVVIAANYRLDTLGWLALDELAAESPTGSYGNYGLQDQGMSCTHTHTKKKNTHFLSLSLSLSIL